MLTLIIFNLTFYDQMYQMIQNKNQNNDDFSALFKFYKIPATIVN